MSGFVSFDDEADLSQNLTFDRVTSAKITWLLGKGSPETLRAECRLSARREPPPRGRIELAEEEVVEAVAAGTGGHILILAGEAAVGRADFVLHLAEGRVGLLRVNACAQVVAKREIPSKTPPRRRPVAGDPVQSLWQMKFNPFAL
jgi:hypothetical protein